MAELTLDPADITAALHKNLDDWSPSLEAETIGYVTSIGDGVARVSGLPGAMASELLEFPGGLIGVALNLDGLPEFRKANTQASFSLYENRMAEPVAADWVNVLKAEHALHCEVDRASGGLDVHVRLPHDHVEEPGRVLHPDRAPMRLPRDGAVAGERLLDREVALKVPHRGRLETKKDRERFVREAQVMQFVGRHPHVVRLRDFGEERRARGGGVGRGGARRLGDREADEHGEHERDDHVLAVGHVLVVSVVGVRIVVLVGGVGVDVGGVDGGHGAMVLRVLRPGSGRRA